MKNNGLKKKAVMTAVASLTLLSGSCLIQSCSKDLLDYEPSYLGNSIYERLQDEGNYKYTLRLIDDLGQTEVLSKTGSRTLFAANDEAFEKFFASNSWGVTRYEDLSYAQKSMLLNSSMIKNAYLIELLSNVSDNPPQEGQCMRRKSGVTVFDSIARIYPDQMPNTEYWAQYKDHKNGIVLMRDNTAKPMIHFLPAYMKLHKITDNDLEILTNNESHSVSDAWVNGKKVIERDITCKNGYIHFVDGVITSSDNMAEIISKHANMSTFSKLLNRFSAPYYDDDATKEYNRLYNNSDSVFTLKYFASTANTGNYGNMTSGDLSYGPDNKLVDAQLLFDPGWNQYIYSNTTGKDLHYDAGAILVPTNEALDTWWNGSGKTLQDMYGTWENVPLKTLVKLMNENMISAFSETVPSKFDNIVDNTTKVSIGIQPSDVDSCFMGCNGVVYLINKVFTPADYSSVSFPALVHENTMSVIYWAISNLNFEPYLNSMDSKYGFFIPTNNAMLTYIDPCSYGSSSKTIMYQFYYDDAAKSVGAHRYYYDLDTKTIDFTSDLADASEKQVENRLQDLLNNLIVVLDEDDVNMTGCTYYKTKSGGYLKIKNAGTSNMTVAGALQEMEGASIPVTTIYPEENGKAYIMEDGMPLTAKKSAYAIMNEHSEYSAFAKLLFDCGLLKQKQSSRTCADYNIKLFDAYNYTIYAPTNESIEQLHDQGILPYKSDIDDLTADDFGGDNTLYKQAKAALTDRLEQFVRYHIQDNSVIIGGKPVSNVKYETFKVNDETKRFYSVTATMNNSSITLSDQIGNTRHVVTGEGLYNNQGREYWITSGDDKTGSKSIIYNASDVVVHLIDGPLFYSSEQLTPWTSLYPTTSSAKKSNAKKSNAKRR